MNIEFLPGKSPDDSLIRIYGSDAAPIVGLAHSLRDLSKSSAAAVMVHEQHGITRIRGCGLTICLSSKDEGIVETKEPLRFIWYLTRASVEVIAELLLCLSEPNNIGCYQWLCGDEARHGLPKSGIGLVVSRDERGNW